jgi:chloramphenicol O-acetyltransferase
MMKNLIKFILNILRKVFFNIRLKKKTSFIKTLYFHSDIKIGKCVKIGKNVEIGNNVEIGDYSYINTNKNWSTIESNVKIGKFCSIGPNVTIALGNHNYNFITTHPILYNKKYKFIPNNYDLDDKMEKTIIGNDVWIGANSNIKRGIKIGNGVVIAMNSVVTKDVPDYAIVAGVPAKIIKYRFDEKQIDVLLKSKWWDNDEETLKKQIEKFYNIDLFIKK